MIFLSNAQLSFFIKKYPFYVMLVLFIMLLFLITIIILKHQNSSRDYKIYYFKINAFILWIYFLIFFLFVIYLRFSRWGFTLNLYDIFTKIHIIVTKNNILISTILFLIVCIIFGILLQIKNMFIRAIMKRHLYTYYSKMYKNLLNHIQRGKNVSSDIVKYHFYVDITKKLTTYWSYDTIINTYIYNSFILPYNILTEKDTYPFWMGTPLKKSILLLPKIILILIIFYECFNNNWTLHIIFYYLPFYIIISLYKKITDFLYKTNHELNRIIYERYYEEENVLYVNTTDNEDAFILNYMANGFKCFSHDVTTWEEKVFFFDFITLFINNRRYFKTKQPFIFQNNNGEQLDSRENEVKEDTTIAIIKHD